MGTLAIRRMAIERDRALQPLVDMNTTPLIDVMLVLLIMLIITIPPQGHRVGLDLPGKVPPTDLPLAVKNELVLTASGDLSWNGRAISDGTLRALFAASAGMEVQPEIHFRPDAAARYERVDEVLAMAARSGVRRFGFVGNEGYRDIF